MHLYSKVKNKPKKVEVLTTIEQPKPEDKSSNARHEILLEAIGDIAESYKKSSGPVITVTEKEKAQNRIAIDTLSKRNLKNR